MASDRRRMRRRCAKDAPKWNRILGAKEHFVEFVAQISGSSGYAIAGTHRLRIRPSFGANMSSKARWDISRYKNFKKKENTGAQKADGTKDRFLRNRLRVAAQWCGAIRAGLYGHPFDGGGWRSE